MNDILKKIEKWPLVPVFVLLYFFVGKIATPIFQIIFLNSGIQAFSPTFTGTVTMLALIALAVLQVVKKCNIAVPIATGILAFMHIISFFKQLVTFFKVAFNGYMNISYLISNFVFGLYLLLCIITLAALTILALYSVGVIKNAGKSELIFYIPSLIAGISFITVVLSSVITLFSVGYYYHSVPYIINTLLFTIPCDLWFTLSIVAINIWLSGIAKEKIMIQ